MEPILLLMLLVVLLALPIWTTFRQNKQLREIREMQARLTPGDEVLTGSGQHGIVAALDEDTVDPEIAEGIVTRWERAAIVRTVNGEDDGADEAEAPTDPAATPNEKQNGDDA